jgi:membrane carboxypeptidase/penicillin-binding protein
MKIRKILAWSGKLGLLGAIFATVYYASEVYSAYHYTNNEILPLEKSTDYPLQISSLTQRQLDILLTVEDPNFFEHHGVDITTPGRGITTITQSLVKHLYFDNFKSGIAKIKQTLIAHFVLDALMSKEMQLKRFINTVYLGPESIGFKQAAHYNFNKDFEQLTEDQYIALVAMIIAPTTFSIEIHPERNKDRVARIKKVISGEYIPKGLFDLYYGKLDKETQKNLAPLSYFESYYQ